MVSVLRGILVVELASSLLLGCTQNVDGTTALGLVGSPAWFMSTTEAQRNAYFRATCAGYGYQSGSPEMAQCIATETRNARAYAADAGAAMATAYTPPSNPTVYTTCNSYGYTTSCTSR